MHAVLVVAFRNIFVSALGWGSSIETNAGQENTICDAMFETSSQQVWNVDI